MSNSSAKMAQLVKYSLLASDVVCEFQSLNPSKINVAFHPPDFSNWRTLCFEFLTIGIYSA